MSAEREESGLDPQAERVTELARVIRIHAPKPPVRQLELRQLASRMLYLAGHLQRMATDDCNGTLSKLDEAWGDELAREFKERCVGIGCKANITGDPRGFVAHIVFPDGHANTWGGAEQGYGIEIGLG